MSIIITLPSPSRPAPCDGVHSDRQFIQAAIDDAHADGGGVVELKAGKTFLAGSVVLRSGVELRFGEGARLLQNSDPADYYRCLGGEYVHYDPAYGHNFSPDIKWSHNWYVNYPLIYAPEGSRDIKVTGRGVIEMMPVPEGGDEALIKICPIGFYRVSGFVVSDVEITNYHSYAMMPFTSDHGLIRNVTIHNSNHGNGDGICLMNCRDIRVTGCSMDTGDDSVYIFSSYRDPRGGGWWSSDEPQPSENIEIDHNDLRSNHCKAFGMILWGIDCPDLEKVEVRNVYVHDNHIQTLGNWNYNPYTTNTDSPPVTDIRFENNEVEAIEPNFFETAVSGMTFYHSMTRFHNGDFRHGRSFWMKKQDEGAHVTVNRGEEPYGEAESDGGSAAALYQGLYLYGGQPLCFLAEVRAVSGRARMFIRDSRTGRTVASRDFDNTGWERLSVDFTAPESANYDLGIEIIEGAPGAARIKSAQLLGNDPAAFGYLRVGMDPQRDWKPLYFINPELWKTE